MKRLLLILSLLFAAIYNSQAQLPDANEFGEPFYDESAGKYTKFAVFAIRHLMSKSETYVNVKALSDDEVIAEYEKFIKNPKTIKARGRVAGASKGGISFKDKPTEKEIVLYVWFQFDSLTLICIRPACRNPVAVFSPEKITPAPDKKKKEGESDPQISILCKDFKVLTTTTFTSGGKNNGAVYSEPVGGKPPYKFLWGNGITDQDLWINVPPGNYTVKVTDANNCTASAVATVGTIAKNDTVNVEKVVYQRDTTYVPVVKRVTDNNYYPYRNGGNNYSDPFLSVGASYQFNWGQAPIQPCISCPPCPDPHPNPHPNPDPDDPDPQPEPYDGGGQPGNPNDNGYSGGGGGDTGNPGSDNGNGDTGNPDGNGDANGSGDTGNPSETYDNQFVEDEGNNNNGNGNGNGGYGGGGGDRQTNVDRPAAETVNTADSKQPSRVEQGLANGNRDVVGGQGTTQPQGETRTPAQQPSVQQAVSPVRDTRTISPTTAPTREPREPAQSTNVRPTDTRQPAGTDTRQPASGTVSNPTNPSSGPSKGWGGGGRTSGSQPTNNVGNGSDTRSAAGNTRQSGDARTPAQGTNDARQSGGRTPASGTVNNDRNTPQTGGNGNFSGGNGNSRGNNDQHVRNGNGRGGVGTVQNHSQHQSGNGRTSSVKPSTGGSRGNGTRTSSGSGGKTRSSAGNSQNQKGRGR